MKLRARYPVLNTHLVSGRGQVVTFTRFGRHSPPPRFSVDHVVYAVARWLVRDEDATMPKPARKTWRPIWKKNR